MIGEDMNGVAAAGIAPSAGRDSTPGHQWHCRATDRTVANIKNKFGRDYEEQTK